MPGNNGNGRASAVKPIQPEPKTFGDHLDLSKLQFGQKLIGWCIFLIIVLSLVDYFYGREGTQLTAAVELLKLVTTTALGFVFAKTQASTKKADDGT